jgi:hypothetical protein
MLAAASTSKMTLVGVSKLAFRGGCIDLIGLILIPGLPFGPKSAVEGAGEDNVLIEESLRVHLAVARRRCRGPCSPG